ncbi:hypothetical protein E4U59_004664 [Claviceps monticola]|nr:hypothetical protein E4U59_004664 [Claviceps monticola]
MTAATVKKMRRHRQISARSAPRQQRQRTDIQDCFRKQLFTSPGAVARKYGKVGGPEKVEARTKVKGVFRQTKNVISVD